MYIYIHTYIYIYIYIYIHAHRYFEITVRDGNWAGASEMVSIANILKRRTDKIFSGPHSSVVRA